MASEKQSVGYCNPPAATRFRKGQSGNPRGRPRGRRKDIPYDSLLGQMVTVREDGRERRVTAAEAFLLQLTRKGLAGDSAAARVSLAAIEAARATYSPAEEPVYRIVYKCVDPGSVGSGLEALGLAVQINRFSETSSRCLLKPWLVQDALRRLGDRQLNAEEQRVVLAATRTPEKVSWPAWWTERN